MATATARKLAPEQTTGIDAATSSSRLVNLRILRKRRKMRNATFCRRGMCVLGVFGMLGYIGLYAQVTAYGYKRAELKDQLRTAAIQNQALKAEVQRLSSPNRLAAVATEAGMEPGTQLLGITTSGQVKVARAD